MGTKSLTLSTSPRTSRISSLHRSSLSLTLRTAPSTSSTTVVMRSRSASSVSCKDFVERVNSSSEAWAASYCSERDWDVCWKDEVVGGRKCGTRYFWGGCQ